MGSAVIFSGTKVKTLKSAIDLNGGNDIISSTTDPTSVAVSANIGSLLLNSSNGKLYRKNDSGSSTNWTEVGASGQAGINYISNPNAVLNTTGWSTYADAAGAAPVDGTGGSANVTWTRSTTTPLRGAADFEFAKDAADRQGQGVSVDFTIDNADIAKPLTVTFDYEIISGTYATGDLTVYLIADPAGTPVVIQPAGYQIQSATASTKMRNIATFQTQASGVSYRLCFHVASTSASAYTLAIDNVVVGPQVVQYGAPITDWVDWTPTGSWTSNTTYTGKYRQVGDTFEYQVNVALSGAPTSAALTVNLPSGQVIDTAKLTNGTNAQEAFGSVSIVVAGSSGYFGGVHYSSTTAVAIKTNSATVTGQYTNVTQAVPGTFQLSDGINIWWRVPIVGKSSTVVMSSDTDTRVVAARASRSASQSINSVTDTKVQFNTVGNDTHGAFSTANNRYTCPVPGYYKFSGVILFASSASTYEARVGLNKNGSQIYLQYNSKSGTASVAHAVQFDFLALANAGDYYEITAFQASGGALNVLGDDTVNQCTVVNVERLTGPSAIAASETVSAAYNITVGGGQSIANTGSTIVNYATKVFDSHNAVTTGASWKFTAPVAGKYQVNASLYYVASVYAVGNIQYIDIYKNGVYLTGGPATTAQTTTSVLLAEGVSSIISLNAGDYIDIRANNNRTAGATTTGDGVSAAISIVKVGI